MSQSKQQPATCMSPESPDTADSQHVTPATKFSAGTSSDARLTTSGSGSRGILRAKVPPPFDLNAISTGARQHRTPDLNVISGSSDPFVSATSYISTNTKSTYDRSQLSPAAAAFTPATVLDSSSTTATHNVPDNEHTRKGHSGRLSDETTAQPGRPNKLLEKLSAVGDSNFWVNHNAGGFTSDDGTSRCLFFRTSLGANITSIEGHLSSELYPSLLSLNLSHLNTQGAIFVKFSDIRDADKAYASAKVGKPQHISPLEFEAQKTSLGSAQQAVSAYEGQVLVTITSAKPDLSLQGDFDKLCHFTKKKLESFGDFLAFETVDCKKTRLIFRVEYCKLGAVEDLFLQKSRLKVQGCNVQIDRYQADFDRMKGPRGKPGGPLIIGQEDTTLIDKFNDISLHGRNGYGASRREEQLIYQPSLYQHSLTVRKELAGLHTPSPLASMSAGISAGPLPYSPAWSSPVSGTAVQTPMWSPFNPGTIGQERLSPSIPPDHRDFFNHQHRTLPRGSSRQPDFNSASHNVVDVGRIGAGLDVRTTIMLRNIPNKIDQAMLKDIIDETSLGKYDFMYLRIDFANNCNVGYAFINFGDPFWIVDFVNARAGHRWNRYNSDKVAEVSYATIQGRDCLVQKFRNSSVMLEHPSFRPKLFRTGTGPLVGTEEHFPPPDNPSKMRRSVENAEHVGLFAPRAGQNFRDEQRRRRTQYDRGTRMAEAEDGCEQNSCHIRGLGQNSPAFQPFGGPGVMYKDYNAHYR